MQYSASLLLVAASTAVAAQSDCDLFQYGVYCLNNPTNLLDVVPGLQSELECQRQCLQTPTCSNFTYYVHQNIGILHYTRPSKYYLLADGSDGTTECLLVSSCDKTAPCLSGCSTAVSGPASPDLASACCRQGPHCPHSSQNTPTQTCCGSG